MEGAPQVTDASFFPRRRRSGLAPYIGAGEVPVNRHLQKQTYTGPMTFPTRNGTGAFWHLVWSENRRDDRMSNNGRMAEDRDRLWLLKRAKGAKN